jgi:hypothetical protein
MTDIPLNKCSDMILGLQEDLSDLKTISEVRESIEYIKGLLHAFRMAGLLAVDVAEEIEGSVKAAGYDRIAVLSRQVER